MQVAKFDIRCPQWALPREEVPVQIKIEKTVTDDIVETVLEIPPGMRLVDTINVAEYSELGGRVVVREMGRARLSEYDYFGIVVATRGVFDDLKKELPVKASFHMKNGSTDVVVTPVRIFRPRLEFASVPDSITLADSKSGDRGIPISLKFSGFGDVMLRCRCTVGGRTVSHESSIMGEMLEAFAHDSVPRFASDCNPRPGTEADHGEVWPVTDPKDSIPLDGPARGAPNTGRTGGEAAARHRPADPDREAFMRHVRRAMSNTVIGTLSDIQARTLGENVQLESQMAVVVPAEIPIDELVVEFRYTDVLGNEYGPIKQTIKIRDQRHSKTGVNVSIPLAIAVDESGAYRDAEVMDAGAHDK